MGMGVSYGSIRDSDGAAQQSVLILNTSVRNGQRLCKKALDFDAAGTGLHIANELLRIHTLSTTLLKCLSKLS